MASDEVLVVIEVLEVLDAEEFAKYQAAAREQMTRRGGRVVARGASLLEGEIAPKALVVQRWRSRTDFEDWLESEEYRPLRVLRRRCARLRIVAVPLLDA